MRLPTSILLQGKSKFLRDVEQVRSFRSTGSATGEWIQAQRSPERSTHQRDVSPVPVDTQSTNSRESSNDDMPEPSGTLNVLNSLPSTYLALPHAEESKGETHIPVVPNPYSLYTSESRSPTRQPNHAAGAQKPPSPYHFYPSAPQPAGSVAAHSNCNPGNELASGIPRVPLLSAEAAAKVPTPSYMDLPDPQAVLSRPASARHRPAVASEITKLEPESRAPGGGGGYGASHPGSCDFLSGFTLPSGAEQSASQKLRLGTSFLPKGSLQQQVAVKAARNQQGTTQTSQSSGTVAAASHHGGGTQATDAVFCGGPKPWLKQPHLGALGSMHSKLTGPVSSQPLQSATALVHSPILHAGSFQHVPHGVPMPSSEKLAGPAAPTSMHHSSLEATHACSDIDTNPQLSRALHQAFEITSAGAHGSSSMASMSAIGSASGVLSGQNQPQVPHDDEPHSNDAGCQLSSRRGAACENIVLGVSDVLGNGTPSIEHGEIREGSSSLGELHGTSRLLRRRTGHSAQGLEAKGMP